MANTTATNTTSEVESNNKDGETTFEIKYEGPCPQPKFTFDEYVAECGPCGPDTPHGALWRELAAAAIKPEVALVSFSEPSSPEAAAAGEPRIMKPMRKKPRLSKERNTADSAILGKRMAVMLVIPEKRDTAVADVRRLIAGEDITEAADWAFYEVELFVVGMLLKFGWWHEQTACDTALYRTASEHIIHEVVSSSKNAIIMPATNTIIMPANSPTAASSMSAIPAAPTHI